MIKRFVGCSQELVLALAWLAFGVFGDNTPFVQNFDDVYPRAAFLFHVGFVVAGVLMIVAIQKPTLMFSSWVYSGVVSFACLVLSLGVSIPPGDALYIVTWALLLLLSVAQSIRHFGGDDCGG